MNSLYEIIRLKSFRSLLIGLGLFCLEWTPGLAQIGGVSGSKLISYTVDVVDHHKVEFEPSFYHFQASQSWDDNGNLVSLSANNDSIKWITGLNFRMTFGIKNRLELGASFSSDLLLANIGARYILLDNEKNGLALLGGFNIPMGNKTVSKSVRFSNTIIKAGGGLVYTKYFNSNLSWDANIQYLRFIEETIDEGKDNWYLSTDLGHYFFNQKLQAVIGLGWQSSAYAEFTSNVLTFYPGMTIETGHNYIIIVNGVFDVNGKNAFKNKGVSLALTLTFD